MKAVKISYDIESAKNERTVKEVTGDFGVIIVLNEETERISTETIAGGESNVKRLKALLDSLDDIRLKLTKHMLEQMLSGMEDKEE